MVRRARVYIPNTAQLVAVRGINNSAVFFSELDYVQWQSIVQSIAPIYALDIHAFALVENTIYLLLTARDEKALGQFMQDLGRRYVRYVNREHQRSGTLWEGRYRTAYIQDAPYVLQAYVWLDGLSEHSSRAQHLGLNANSFIREHAQYWQLGNTPFERQTRYAQLLERGLTLKTQPALAHAVQTGWMLADETMMNQIESETGQRVRPKPRGRPRKSSEISEAASDEI